MVGWALKIIYWSICSPPFSKMVALKACNPTAVGNASNPTALGNASNLPVVGNASNPTAIGNASNPTALGNASNLPVVGNASNPTAIGNASNPTAVGSASNPAVGNAGNPARECRWLWPYMAELRLWIWTLVGWVFNLGLFGFEPLLEGCLPFTCFSFISGFGV